MTGKTITSEKIRGYGRLSYPKLDKAVPFSEGQTPKFQAALLLDPSDVEQAKTIALVKAAAQKLYADKWGTPPADRKPPCYGLGDKLPKIPEGYKGMFYVRLSNDGRPGVANRAGRPVAAGDKEFPYAGSYCNINFTLWTQDNKYGKRINGNLIAVQYVKDGTAFGRGPVAVEDEFEPLPDAGGGPAQTSPGAATAVDDVDF